MIFQPTLNYDLMSTQSIHYLAHHSALLTTPDNPKNDETHIHNCYEIYMNLSGDVSFLVNDQLYAIQKGDIVLTRPGDVHFCIYHSKCVHEHYCLWIEAPNNSPLLEFMYKKNFRHHISLESTSVNRCAHLLSKLANNDTNSSNLLIKTSALMELSLLLQGDSLLTTNGYSAQMPKELKSILSYLNTHFCEIMYVKEIYNLFYVSPATLNRWFRKYLHISPREFLESKKLAYNTGFNDLSYFIKIFKRYKGVTPKRYLR